MKNNVKLFLPLPLFIFSITFFFSCDSNGINSFISRSDPFPDNPSIKSLSGGKALSLSWKADTGADSYLVMRSIDGQNGLGAFEEIYSGDETVYLDRDIDVCLSYAYRLDKQRGGKIFKGSDIAYFIRTLPFADEVTALGLEDGSVVRLSWNTDENADSYILRKQSIDQNNNRTNLDPIELGQTMYIDSELEIDKIYSYRLDKVRGSELFEGSAVTLYSRMRPEPTPGVITVLRLNEGTAAYLLWDADTHADSYIIMKTETGIAGVDFTDDLKTVKIELTGKTSYIDNDIDTGKAYAYRLDKVQRGVTHEGLAISTFEKSRSDPVPGVITARSLNGGTTAYLTWTADNGADSYRVMRSLNDGSAIQFTARADESDGFFLQSKTSAMDTGLADDKSYLYRLDKERNGQWVIGTEITVFSQTRPFPFGEAPIADGFRADGKIALNWSNDDGADSYILMRREDDPANSSFTQWKSIWEGQELTYVDDTVNPEKSGRYEYRLNKRRNGTIYEWVYDVTLAVAAGVEQDAFEPNNIQSQATILDNSRTANLYCFGYSDGQVLSDADWYKVNIPAGKTAHIKVIYSTSTSGSEKSWFDLYLPGQTPVPIPHNTNFAIKNEASVQQYIAFAIRPRTEEFLTDGRVGGCVVTYTIMWHEISNN
ncbi:hypothetical protein K7I13_11025 [Brucepastera parasyntrophica]|uniref:hypothetical protein n=1 Tax=Brucepastera parasyntrophica TaxID=2880008 RepID=UPI00210AED73|nr:hypothetical protein [Brucepastera parasyntrophica]ULQ59040.1 hypothetical protein K7I13_11025 [Brucepastera parasyntrophica]